ncbi:MAG: hypothetical protein DWQ04_00610 [Chloroflexi bacterium]|nr:MAG: hypothetical protein DWQ04_00610 [Chloroflexota bacterium]
MRVRHLILIIFCLIGCSSCSKSESPKSLIVGKWIQTEGEGVWVEKEDLGLRAFNEPNGFVIVFNEDNTGTFANTQTNEVNEFNWKFVTNGTLIIDGKYPFSVSVSEKELEMRIAAIQKSNRKFARLPILGVHSNTSPNSSFASGHAWISKIDFVANSFEYTMYGLWPDGHKAVNHFKGSNDPSVSDIRINYEKKSSLHNRYYSLSEKQVQVLMTLVSEYREWSYTYTCASFAEEVVFTVVGEDVDADDIVGFETPRELSESIELLEAEHSTTHLIPAVLQDPNASSLSNNSNSFEGSVHDP